MSDLTLRGELTITKGKYQYCIRPVGKGWRLRTVEYFTGKTIRVEEGIQSLKEAVKIAREREER